MKALPFFMISMTATVAIVLLLKDFDLPWWVTVLVILYSFVQELTTCGMLWAKGYFKDDGPAEEGGKS
jgi:hypothetical protein